ncbi:TPR repeat region-containing protein [Mycobacteroides abscessus]|uniref:TPR repeat region-containing protein n=1 Tax=Mycobacteroides abscessus TaxID=36809 RepID=UPI0021026C25|nr:hypothetical protein [Mycobacteroides abscessus]
MGKYSLRRLLSAHPEKTVEPFRQVVLAAAELQQSGQDYKHAIDKPGGQPWEGQTARAAQDTAAADEKTVYRTGQIVLDGSPKVLDALTFRVTEFHRQAVDLYNEATTHGYTVAEDLTAEWIVQPRSTPEIIEKGKQLAAKFTKMLRGAYDKWWAAEEEAKGLIDAISNELQTSFNPVGGLTANQGNLDGAYFQGGTQWDKDVLKRVQAASALTDQDMADIKAGKDVNIGSNRMQYLYQFAHAFDGKSDAEINKSLDAIKDPTDRAAVKTALSHAFSVVSNDQVKSGVPNTEGVTEATKKNFIPAAGSLSNLPEAVRASLTDPNRIEHTLGPRNQMPEVKLHGVGDLQEVAKMFAPAGEYLNGSEAGKAMLGAASDYTNAHIDHWKDVESLSSDAHGDLKSALADVYQVGAKDHVDVAELAHQSVTDLAAQPDGHHNDADSFLKAVNEERWGSQSPKLAEVFDWAAQNPHDPLSASLANSEAHFMADKEIHDTMQNLPGGNPLTSESNNSFGHVNSELAESVAKLEAPHVGQYTGLNPQEGIEQFNTANQLNNMMSTLDRNSDAANIINGAAHQQYLDNLQHTAELPPDHQGTNVRDGGRLLQGSIDGAKDAMGAGDADARDTAKKFLSTVGGGAIGDVSDIMNATEKAELQKIGDTTTIGPYGTTGLDKQAAILNGLLNSHPDIAHDPKLSDYITGNQIDPAKIAKYPNSVVEDAFQNWFNGNKSTLDLGDWRGAETEGRTTPKWR